MLEEGVDTEVFAPTTEYAETSPCRMAVNPEASGVSADAGASCAYADPGTGIEFTEPTKTKRPVIIILRVEFLIFGFLLAPALPSDGRRVTSLAAVPINRGPTSPDNFCDRRA